MKKILNIVSSAKGKDSFSVQLSDAILEKLTSVYPDSIVKTNNLAKNPLPHLEESNIASFYTPQDMRTDEHKEAIKNSDQAIKELMEADILVIGVPLYNFGIPSTLKAWIDHIARSGVTFTYANGFPEGLVVNKKVYLAIASGGVYSEGPMKSYDFTEPYLRAVLGFIGMKDITAFRVEGTVVPDLKETALPKALESVNTHAFEAIAEEVK
jgi:FMN-dependent NADH-azoreductase